MVGRIHFEEMVDTHHYHFILYIPFSFPSHNLLILVSPSLD
jgi:hypothetical protein